MIENDLLKLENQLCHPIYSASNALLRVYKRLLDPLDLTYPQYLIMLTLWEKDRVNISYISERTYFDSGTLTPLLKKLHQKGFIAMKANKEDKRNRVISLTKAGLFLKGQASDVPTSLACSIQISRRDVELFMKIVRSLHQSLLEHEKRFDL
jgi:DNA-binding MarR family transcriptional regulator